MVTERKLAPATNVRNITHRVCAYCKYLNPTVNYPVEKLKCDRESGPVFDEMAIAANYTCDGFDFRDDYGLPIDL